MVTARISRFVVGVAVATALAVPTIVTAQNGSTFVVEFDRTGPPEFEIDPVTGQQIQVGGAFLNPCTKEFVDVLGATTITIVDTLDNKGNRKIDVKTVTKGTGAGWTAIDPITLLQMFSGKVYAFSESQSFIVKAPVGTLSQAFESDFFDKIAMKGAGKIDNWMIRARFRIKIAADGTIMVNLVRLTQGDGCKG